MLPSHGTAGRPAVLALAACAALALVTQGAARADTASLPSTRDNTLYESSTGSLSSGAGPTMFAGRTAQLSNSRRRALVRFDVASAIPAGSVIQSVEVHLFCSQTASASAQNAGLHHVLADWGEGASNAGESGGAGAPAAAGDATWIHRFYPGTFWTAAGGDFSPAASAVVAVAGPGNVTWSSTAALVQDVQGWLDQPATNFGWLVLGNESVGSTALRFDTREAGDPAVEPLLVVTYQAPATPAVAATWGQVKGAYR